MLLARITAENLLSQLIEPHRNVKKKHSRMGSIIFATLLSEVFRGQHTILKQAVPNIENV